MAKSSWILLCCVVAAGCQRQEAPQNTTRVTTRAIPSDAKNARIDTVVHPLPAYVDRSLLGSEIGPDGNVAKDATTFARGDRAYFTMFLQDSPVGLHTKAVWTDSAKKEIHREEREMKGAKVATFALDTKKLKPGVYRVEGYWGGNLAVVKDFEIGKRKK